MQRPPAGTCKRKGFLRGCPRVASAGACVVHSARRRAAVRSAWLNATGLPCMLLDVRALAAISSACCGRTAGVARRGTANSVRVWRIQARIPSRLDRVLGRRLKVSIRCSPVWSSPRSPGRKSWIDAVGCPVSSRAAWAWLCRAAGEAPGVSGSALTLAG